MEMLDWQIMTTGLGNKINQGIIIYGASSNGERVIMLLKQLNLNDKILAIIDSDEKKWGKTCLGYEIKKPEIIDTFSSEVIIIIASVYLNEIFMQLVNNYKCKQNLCSSFAFKHAIHYELMNDKTNIFNTEVTLQYRKKYELWENALKLRNYTLQQKEYFETVKCIIENPVSILLCGIQKTGNTSLVASFNEKKQSNIAFTRHALYFDQYTFNNLKEVLHNFNNNEIKIISGVREPVERIISQIWEHICIPFLCNDTFITDVLDEKNLNCITDLIQYVELSGIKYDCTSCFYLDIADWFKDNIEKIFGINVFDYTFDKEKGYSVIRKDNISIFLYRLDKLNKLEKEIIEFTGKNYFKLIKDNISSNKKYIFAYKEYLNHVKINKNLFDKLIHNNGMSHFYTFDEYEQYICKWKDKLI